MEASSLRRQRSGATLLALATLVLATSATAQFPAVRGVSGNKCQVLAGCTDMTVPTGTQAGDLLILALQNDPDGDVIATPSGWAHAPGSPSVRSVAPSARCTVFTREAVAADVDGTCEACDVADPGNHLLGRMMAITGGTFPTGAWSDGSGAGNGGNQTAKTIAAGSASVANSLIVAVNCDADDALNDTNNSTDSSNTNASGTGTEYASWSNNTSGIANLTERIDNSTIVGDDGALGVATMTFNTTGSWGTTSVTGPSAGSANLSFNIKPVQPTATATSTQTATATATATATNTFTATATGTATHTATHTVPPATPTDTATPTVTATVTRTPTETPITPPRRMPDLTGPTPGVPDGLYGFAIDGDGRTDMAWGNGADSLLVHKLRDPDGLCQYTRADADSASVAVREEGLRYGELCIFGVCAYPAGSCDRWTSTQAGVIKRGINAIADIVAVDIGAIYEYTQTWTSPRTGKCWGGPDAGGTCRVNAKAGQFAQGKNARCVDGLGFGSSCRPPGTPGMTPTPCLNDPAPNDPLTSYCQPQVWNAGDGMSVVGCRAPGLCQERARLGAVKTNIRRSIEAIRARGALPLLLMPYLPATWRDAQCSVPAAVPITPKPNGTPVPDPNYKAAGEVAVCDLAAISAWAHLLVDNYKGDQLPWIDLDRLAAAKSGSRRYRILGDQILASSAGKGSCTCLVDSDCGGGGTCSTNGGGGLTCSAGARATCSSDADCVGANSEMRPGEAWCLIDTGADWIAQAIRACLEDWANMREPEWETQGILACNAARIPMNPAFTPWPRRTATPAPTDVPTITQTATPSRTDTPPGNPTATATATSTSTGTATHTSNVTMTPTTTPTPGALRDSCVGVEPLNPKICDKIGPALFRSGRDWATWIDPARGGYGIQSSSGTGYQSCTLGTIDGAKCRVYPMFGASAFNNEWSPPTFDNEVLCNEPDTPGTCTRDIVLNTDENAGIGKFQHTSNGVIECAQSDWMKAWQWFGDPPMPLCGYCDNDGTRNCSTTTGSCPCSAGNPGCTGGSYATTCASGGQCVAKCDVTRFGTGPADGGADPPPGSDPAPPGARAKPKSPEIYDWEAVRCYHEEYAVPVWRGMYDRVRALTREDTGVGKITDRCAENAVNQLFNDLSQFVISFGCVGECSNKANRACTFNADCACTPGVDPGCTASTGTCRCLSLPGESCAQCQRNVAFCVNGWDSAAMQGTGDCGTCALGARDAEQQFTCPATCSTAQISCETWQSWCEWLLGSPAVGTASGVLSPVRYGCRQRPRPGFE